MTETLIRDRYEPTEVLGRGGQGEVLRAVDRQHDREIALKVRPVRDAAERDALLAEARILLSLRPHPNLPLVREDFFWQDRYVLAMDFVAGTDLRQVLTETGDPGLPIETVVPCLEQAADALGHLHAQGVVHGDVKPANLVLTPDGRVVLVDFGIARRAGEPGERTFGTPGYSAPELHTGAMTPAVDVYGLAATAVALLTGSPPSVGRPNWRGVAHAEAIERALRRGLAIDPTRRPRTAADLIARLRTHLALDLPTGIVTFLLCDVEGSTARWETDPDGMSDLITRHDSILGEAVESHDGRLLTPRGEGDATVSVFTRASDAVAAAVAAQLELRRLELPVRMAIHTGEAELRDGRYVGRSINRASRLRTVARGGQIILSGAAADLAGHALPEGAALTDLGFQQLRDLTRGEQAFAVTHPDLASTPPSLEPAGREGGPARVPPSVDRLPSPLALLRDVTFVGRRADLDRLMTTWWAARAGGRRVALLGGDAGIGKTHLAAALAREVQEDGGAVLYGSCDEGLQVPYQPFAAALAQVVEDAADQGAIPLLGRHPAELVRLVPQLGERLSGLEPPPRADPDTDQHRLFDAVADWLRSVTSVVPALFILDDLHWATRPTLQLLRHVAQALDPMPLLIVGTFRDEDVGRRAALTELLADIHRLDGVERITLGGLNGQEVIDLLETATGRTLAPAARALARAVRAETGGNPFFLRQFLRHLIDNGTLVHDDQERWTVEKVTEPLGVPEGVREVMARRLGRLSDAALATLEVAAVAGNEFELATVVEAADLDDEESVLTAVEEGIAARLLVETGPFRFRFAHTLVRSSVLDRMAGARRSRLHQRVAESIESVHRTDLGEHLATLAKHYAEVGSPGDAERAVAYAIQAGDEALTRLDYDEAVASFRLALDLLDRTPNGSTAQTDERVRLLLMLGEAERLAGEPSYRDTLLEAGRLALDRGDAAAVAAAALANRRTQMALAGATDAERVAVLEAAVDLQSSGEGATLARLLALLAFELIPTGEWARRVALSDRAVAIARRLGDPSTLADVLALRSETIAHPSTVAERVALAEEEIRLAEPLEEPALLVRGLLNGVVAAFEAGDLAQVDHLLDRAERLAGELAHPLLRWQTDVQRAKRLTLAGRFDEAATMIGTAFQLGHEAGQPDAPLVFAAQQYRLSTPRGRAGEVLPVIDAAIEEHPDRMGLLVARARLLEAIGRPDEARVTIDGATAEGFDRLTHDQALLSIAANIAVVAYRLGLPDTAALVVPVLEPFAGNMAADRVNVFGAVVHFLGLAAFTLGELDTAERRLTESIDVHRRIGAPALLAEAQAHLARVLIERRLPGDTVRIERLLDESRATATDLGLEELLTDIADMA